MDEALGITIQSLADALKTTVNGRYALAIAGSHAKGMADAGSDIDFFLFCEEPKLLEERRRIIGGIADPDGGGWISPNFHDGAWGGSMDFRYHGIPVETTVKLLPEFEKVVADSLEGQFTVEPALWTSNGYYSYICLSELDFIKPLDDPFGILADYKKRIAVYPFKLKRSIVREFLGRAGTWLGGNFHYVSAVRRQDVLFTVPIVSMTLQNMVQVMFALNEAYFTGDKKLERQLGKLVWCPLKLIENLDFLLTPWRDSDKLERQRILLEKLWRELFARAKAEGNPSPA